jgi:MFS family permease
MLIADRFLLGGAAVTVQVAVTAFIAELFVAEERMKMIAWQGMAVELGGVVFLAVGGVLGEINWQWPFYVYLMAFVCLFLVLKSLPSTPPIRTQETVVSSEGNGNKAKVRIIFAASLLSMMLFFVAYVSLPFYLPETFQFSESDTGFYLSFISIIAVITASQMPKVVRLLGGGKTVVLGFFFFMLGYVVIASTTSLFLLILTAIFFGIGFGFTIPLLNYMMIEVSTPQDQGKNLSLFSMGVFGGQFLSTFIQYISSNYVAVYAVSALLAFSIGGILYYFFQKESQN